MKKTVLTLFIFLLLLQGARAARAPILGTAGIEATNPRTQALARLVELHLGNILRSNLANPGNSFETINPETLQEQLARFNCLEDTCLLRFAARAGISVLFRGSLDERTDSLELEIRALGAEAPYFGRTVYRYRASIPTKNLRLSTREYSYIFEEHAARFVGEFLRRYQRPVYFRIHDNSPVLDTGEAFRGVFTVYRSTPVGNPILGLKRYCPLGAVTLGSGAPHAQFRLPILDGDFILVGHRDRAAALDEFYYGRKREIVLAPGSLNDSFSMLLFTVPGSLTMPLASPILGYFADRDYMGLALWSLNAPPYLYMEYRGLSRRPRALERERENISRDDIARYRFSLYMLLCGNMALFVDAFAGRYLYLASNYQGVQPYMGNSYTAAYLSLVSGGGGHFYRGSRCWGYLYFHLNNILLYYTLREFSADRVYDPVSGKYIEGDIDRTRGRMFLGAYCVLKSVEIIHSILMRDRLRNGTVEDGGVDIVPFAMHDGGRGLQIGASFIVRL